MSDIVVMHRTGIPRLSQVHQVKRDSEKGDVRVLPVHTLCKELTLP